MELTVTPVMEGVEAGHALTIHLFIANRSAVPLKLLSLSVFASGLEVVRPAHLQNMKPFYSFGDKIVVRFGEGAALGNRKIPFTLRYRWQDGPFQGESTQQTTIPIEVRPVFSEEAKGLPGGTGALFSLLFPVIPAFLAFQIVDRWRKHEGLQVPTFGSDYVLPAFFMGLAVNYLAWIPCIQKLGLGDLPTRLALSLILGIGWPLAHWGWDIRQWRLWGFRDTDEPATYLRKALRAPRFPRQFTWTEGTVNEETWEGILLYQPDGSLVLGSRLQINLVPNHAKKASEILNAEEASQGQRGKCARTLEELLKELKEAAEMESWSWLHRSRRKLLSLVERGWVRRALRIGETGGELAKPVPNNTKKGKDGRYAKTLEELEELEKLLKELIKGAETESGTRLRRSRRALLLSLVERGAVAVRAAAYPVRGKRRADCIVVTGGELARFQRKAGETRPLLTYSH